MRIGRHATWIYFFFLTDLSICFGGVAVLNLIDLAVKKQWVFCMKNPGE